MRLSRLCSLTGRVTYCHVRPKDDVFLVVILTEGKRIKNIAKFITGLSNNVRRVHN